MTTTQQRFENASSEVRKSIPFTVNVMSCCRSCAWHNATELNLTEEQMDEPFAWTFGGQGRELVWDEDGNPLNQEEWYCDLHEDDEDECDCDHKPRLNPAEPLFVYFQGLGAARAARDAFMKNGFSVYWNGTEMSAVEIEL